MLDNKRLTSLSVETLRSLSYESKVKLYDKNCAKCPFALIQTKRGRFFKRRDTLEEAIEVAEDNRSTSVVRGCCYGGDEFSLNEIVMNTCRLWKKETQELEDEDE
jgi:hypothetical protein